MKTEWSRQMVYRTNAYAYRIGNVLEILVQIVIWTAIFRKASIVKGYTYQEMMTYIIIGWMLAFLMTNFNFEEIISNRIQKGELSNFLSKPVDYVNYLIVLSIARAIFTIGVAVLIVSLVLFVFRQNFIISGDVSMWLVLIAMVLLGYFINLFISILVGFLSFWTVDNSGIFYSIHTLKQFLSGMYFPINILPAIFLNFSLAFPFIYTFYYPAQLYLGKVSVKQGLFGLGFEIVWLVILYIAIKVVWKRGLKKYESVGI